LTWKREPPPKLALGLRSDDQVEVEPSVPGEVVEDIDVFFFRHTFLVFFGVAGGVGDGSSDGKL